MRALGAIGAPAAGTPSPVLARYAELFTAHDWDGVRALLADPTNGFMFSSVVIWEATIKSALGRKDFAADPRLLRRGLLGNGAVELPITSDHGIAVADLPPLHKDPFDRIEEGDPVYEVWRAGCDGTRAASLRTIRAWQPTFVP